MAILVKPKKRTPPRPFPFFWRTKFSQNFTEQRNYLVGLFLSDGSMYIGGILRHRKVPFYVAPLTFC